MRTGAELKEHRSVPDMHVIVCLEQGGGNHMNPTGAGERRDHDDHIT